MTAPVTDAGTRSGEGACTEGLSLAGAGRGALTGTAACFSLLLLGGTAERRSKTEALDDRVAAVGAAVASLLVAAMGAGGCCRAGTGGSVVSRGPENDSLLDRLMLTMGAVRPSLVGLRDRKLEDRVTAVGVGPLGGDAKSLCGKATAGSGCPILLVAANSICGWVSVAAAAA